MRLDDLKPLYQGIGIVVGNILGRWLPYGIYWGVFGSPGTLMKTGLFILSEISGYFLAKEGLALGHSFFKEYGKKNLEDFEQFKKKGIGLVQEDLVLRLKQMKNAYAKPNYLPEKKLMSFSNRSPLPLLENLTAPADILNQGPKP